jgi:hypothetical protein
LVAADVYKTYPGFPSAFSTLTADVPTSATAAFRRSGVTFHLLHHPTTSGGLLTSTWARSQEVGFRIVALIDHLPNLDFRLKPFGNISTREDWCAPERVKWQPIYVCQGCFWLLNGIAIA